MDKRNRIIKIFAAPFITVLIMLILYAVKGITPFGSGNILGGDLYQQGVFDFFYVYDSIRSGSFFYDFFTAGGFEREILTNIFIPCYWPLAFIPRSGILVYISL
ncbi:MAG: YfhO family protein, partial [Eubacterium sp.]|nr:YfhO family protein [Eubacterium sp.]